MIGYLLRSIPFRRKQLLYEEVLHRSNLSAAEGNATPRVTVHINVGEMADCSRTVFTLHEDAEFITEALSADASHANTYVDSLRKPYGSKKLASA